MMFPEDGPTQYYVLTDRGISGPPTIVFFEDWPTASGFVDWLSSIDGSASSTIFSVSGMRANARARAKRESEWDGITFKPCPYCGARLTCHDISFVDEDGGEVDDQYVDRELFVWAVAISCGCGCAKVVSAEAIRWPIKGWKRRFADSVNARAVTQ